MLSHTTVAAGVGVVLVLILLAVRWRWRRNKLLRQAFRVQEEEDCPPCTHTQLVHRLCPHHNVVQSFEVQQKDSLDDHLDVLTRKLAEKEGRLRLSKSKIRETQHEIENLHAIDHDVRLRYREIMESLRTDLLTNEKECKRLQEQIEWVSRRRAELREEMGRVANGTNCECVSSSEWDEFAKDPSGLSTTFKETDSTSDMTGNVRRGQRLYGEAAAELASNLAELQRGRGIDQRVTAKPQAQLSSTSLRHRKEPHIPRASPPVASLIIKSPPSSVEDNPGSPVST